METQISDNFPRFPFIHDSKRDERANQQSHGDNPCIICGRYVKKPSKYSARLCDGGSNFAPVDIEIDWRNDMGFYPIGPECRKKLPKNFVNEHFDSFIPKMS